MSTVTITEILDDLRAADKITRRFERRYWLSSADFYELYRQGLLDDGEHTEDFTLWASFYEIKLDRQEAPILDGAHWAAISTTLHEQAQQLDLSAEDRRDAEYWAIVAPLLEETERTPSSV